jgi:hypothetical protein
VYPTAELAKARIAVIENEFGLQFAWYDEVKVGANGADCFFANR